MPGLVDLNVASYGAHSFIYLAFTCTHTEMRNVRFYMHLEFHFQYIFCLQKWILRNDKKSRSPVCHISFGWVCIRCSSTKTSQVENDERWKKKTHAVAHNYPVVIMSVMQLEYSIKLHLQKVIPDSIFSLLFHFTGEKKRKKFSLMLLLRRVA